MAFQKGDRRISFMDFLRFHEFVPPGGWSWNADVHRQFFYAAKDWPSHKLSAPLFPIDDRETIEYYKFFFDEEDSIVMVFTEDNEYFSLNELEIVVNEDLADEIEDKKDFYGVPTSLCVM